MAKTNAESLRAIAFLLAFGCCAVVGARNLSLDLTGSEGMSKSMPRKVLMSAGAEEIRTHRLVAGAAKVSGLAVGDVVSFKLFADETLAVTLVEETSSLTGRAFLGRIDNALGAYGCVVLETDEGVVLDVTDFERQRVWQVVSDATGVIVREMKPTCDKHCGSDTLPDIGGQSPVNVSVTTFNGVTTVITNGSPVAATPASAGVAVSSDVVARSSAPKAMLKSGAGDKPTVDILVNYDTDAAAWARSNGGGLTNFAETCVQKMNTALANTGLDSYFRFRLVGVYEVGGSAGGNISYALNFASGSYAGTLNGVSWEGVRTERDRVSADIVCTLCDNGSSYGVVGIGRSLKSGSNSADCGFNACLIRSVATSHTMTHEVGHNMGAGHSDKMADADNCGPQYYSYSSGYYFYVGSTGYFTIMAYNSDGYGNYYTEVPYFSSPNHTFRGVAVGTSINDNTRTLRMNYQMVADNLKPPFVSSEIGQGLEAESYVWTTSGAQPWSRVTSPSYDGVDSSRSCEMAGRSTSWTETRIVGPATLSFKVRLRTAYGWFNVLVDGAVRYTLGDSSTVTSSNPSWTSASVSIPSGAHTVRLAYTHNGAGYTSGGNGAWVDQLSFAGGTPVVGNGATTTTEVPVPYDWLATYYPNAATSAYETIASRRGANGYYVWQSYVAGLNPTSAASVFKAVLTFENGKPVVRYSPQLSTAETALRRYTIYGKKSLMNANWTMIPSGSEKNYNFFKVTVEMR